MVQQAELAMVVRMRDEASQKLETFGQKLDRVEPKVAELGMTLGILGAALTGFALFAAQAADTSGKLQDRVDRLKRAGEELMATIGKGVLPILIMAIDVLTKMLELVNKLPEPLLKVGGSMAIIGGGALAVAASLALLADMAIKLYRSLKMLIPLQVIQRVLMMGPAGIALAAAAVAAGVATAGALMSFQQGGEVPGPVGAPRLAVVHGGERIYPPGRGGDVHLHIGNYYGDDMSRRELARDIHRIIREEERFGR